ncbi:MAG: T9SS type A sorting domain-containing protein [Ignavibacteria bacterium]|nr:T9SS type A sorting domain-containing protein [Ignavibacteria bacterium]
MNYWNRITVEKAANGYVKVWINGNVIVNNYSLGTCASQDVVLALSSWENGRTIQGYIDDVTIYYEPTEISNISSEVPREFFLSQNYPNPFNPTTNIEFSIPEKSFVKLNVYDVSGRKVSQLVNENLSSGTFRYDFNAENLPSGTYFYKLETEKFTETKKMILMK